MYSIELTAGATVKINIKDMVYSFLNTPYNLFHQS